LSDQHSVSFVSLKPKFPRRLLQSCFFIQTIALKLGHLYFGYKLSRAWWHCVVLYGVTTPSDDEPVYHIMDPDPGQLTTRTKADFFADAGKAGVEGRVILGWKSR